MAVFAGISSNLTHRIAVYVPGGNPRTNLGTALQQSWTDTMLEAFGTFFGGSTAVNVQGTWIGLDDKVVREPVNMVYSYCTSEQYDKHQADVLHLAKCLANGMKREAVAVEVDGALFLVTP